MKLSGLTVAEAALYLLKGESVYREYPHFCKELNKTIHLASQFKIVDGEIWKKPCGHSKFTPVVIDISSEEFNDSKWYLSAHDWVY